MRELQDEELEILKKVLLEMLVDIDLYCKDNGLKYSLAAGTLLGAIRHKGFIPWDDDIDIMMSRQDYEKMFADTDSFLAKKYDLLTYENNEDYGLPFAKIVNRGVVLVEKNSRNTKIPHGVFIDVFPIDKAPLDLEMRSIRYRNIQKCKSKLLCRSGYIWDKGFFFDYLYKMRGIALRLWSKQKFITEIKKECDYGYCEYMYVSYCGDVGIEKASYQREWFNNYTEVSFESHLFSAISEFHNLLTLQYGNYMELPKESDRRPHHLVSEFYIKESKLL